MAPFDEAWLIATILAATPLLLAALGELVSERGGVLNVGIEGMMLGGAFACFVATWSSGSAVVGVLAGMAAGAAVAALAAALTVFCRADQIVVGIGINLLVLSLTSFLFTEALTNASRITVDRPGRIAIPLLSDLPVVGRALFDQQILVYVAFLLVPCVAWLLGRTGWGLGIRAVGEDPRAADSAGVSVPLTRWSVALAAGVGAGLAGSFLVLFQVGAFTQGMTAGRGYLALAAVIFGRWRATGVLLACLVFGAADALQFRLQAQNSVPSQVWVAMAIVAVVVTVLPTIVGTRRPPTPRALVVCGVVVAAGIVLAVVDPTWQLPKQLWLALPYILTLGVLAGLAGRTRMPAALGTPYTRSEA